MDLETFLENCQQTVGYRFRNIELLRMALTHSSGANTPQESNERMEFLGDSVLAYTICSYLYATFPEMLEGDMTKIKSQVVSRISCGDICKRIGLDKFLILGRGLGRRNGIPDSIFANLLESFIAAIYLDSGLETAQTFILQVFQEEISVMLQDHDAFNNKSVLQQYAQKQHRQLPEYTVLEVQGPEHRKVFHIAVKIGETDYPSAWGVTKKVAEQRAAENALAVLQGKPVPYLG